MLKKGQKVIFSGIQPTGKIHIGNYLGAIKNWVRLQNNNLDAQNIYCIVDYHALTDKYKLDHQIDFQTNIKNDSILMFATLVACGIDPKKSILFIQSSVPQHTELQWILSCIAPQNWLNKMTQYKDKQTKTSTLGLFCYPVLMAADIILYQANDVPVGEDQKQHVELTRDYVVRFNSLFAKNKDDQLVIPNYVKSQIPRVMSLKDGQKKMSKSDTNDMNRINLMDDRATIIQKIQKAKTDSNNKIIYNPIERPEVSNLIRIYAQLKNIETSQVEQEFSGKTIIQFKEELSKVVIFEVEQIAKITNELMQNQEKLAQMIENGNQSARRLAESNINQIKRMIGLI